MRQMRQLTCSRPHTQPLPVVKHEEKDIMNLNICSLPGVGGGGFIALQSDLLIGERFWSLMPLCMLGM
jgi:hypothetical protein